MKTRLRITCWLMALLLIASACTAAQASSLKMRISTRSGPATEYDELGSFFNKNWQTQDVQVISRSHDGNIWWLQVDFTNKSDHYRAYTGLKRVNVDIDTVPDEAVIGSGYLTTDVTAYAGPGMDYVRLKTNVMMGTDVTIYAEENGFLQVEYYEPRFPAPRRTWVVSDAVSGSWSQPSQTSSTSEAWENTTQDERLGLYQSTTDGSIYIALQSVAAQGGTSHILLHLTDAYVHFDLPVTMETDSYGTFTAPDGNKGYLWLLDGALMIDMDVPTLDINRAQYLPQV